MKNKVVNRLKTAIGCVIGVFVVVTGYRITDYLSNPELYLASSAPWYTNIIIHALFSAAVIMFLLAALSMEKKKKR